METFNLILNSWVEDSIDPPIKIDLKGSSSVRFKKTIVQLKKIFNWELMRSDGSTIVFSKATIPTNGNMVSLKKIKGQYFTLSEGLYIDIDGKEVALGRLFNTIKDNAITVKITKEPNRKFIHFKMKDCTLNWHYNSYWKSVRLAFNACSLDECDLPSYDKKIFTKDFGVSPKLFDEAKTKKSLKK